MDPGSPSGAPGHGAADSSTSGEVRLHGIAVSPGIARGVAVVHRADDDEQPARRSITDKEVGEEITRFESALVATRQQITEMQQRIMQSIGAGDAGIFDAHLLVVEDQTLIDEVVKTLRDDLVNVEFAFHKIASRYAESLSQIDDAYLRERALDIQDVARRVLRNLSGIGHRPITTADHPHILVAHNLTPSDTATMDRSLVLGFATEAGSKTSHTAIMARSLDIPAVVGLHGITDRLTTGDTLLLDGYNGLLFLRPTEQTLFEYGQLEQRKDTVERSLDALRDIPPVTTDGRHIILSANIELPEEVEFLKGSGAEGIGLYRTEFFFLDKPEPPDEDEQYENYRRVAEAIAPQCVIIRTIDLGGDKLHEGIAPTPEANPFLGWRAVRVCLERTDLFKTQLRAILRASAQGNVKLMYPFICCLDEIRAANQILEECRQELRAEGKPFAEEMEVGAMIEVPSAAIAADLLAPEVDFFSIGTNDLVQYTLAVDRLNDRISHLYQPAHPAILRLIKTTVDAAHAHGKWTGVCGEMAGEVSLVPLLIGLGVDELSVGSGLLLHVKRAIRALSYAECQALAVDALNMQLPSQIVEKASELARLRYPELFE
jgi:phosphoenolpyruvate-protein phosphotransferase (PTS system enzyme I)